jgi:hypothetical protein
MENLKQFFKENEWELITEVLKTDRKTPKGKEVSWITLAKKFDIRPEGSNKQRRTSANDVYRRFLRHTTKKQIDLTVVKQTVNGSGEILFETRKRLPEEQEFSLDGLVIDKITTNPHGGQWVSYKKPNVAQESEELVPSAIERLFEKYSDFTIKEEDTFLKDFLNATEEDENFFNQGANPKVAVLNLYDAHLDKLPVKSTCGVESTLENNIDVFHKTVDRIIPYIVTNNVEEIIFPVGNDLFHTNGFNSQTKKGTNIEYFGSPEDAYYSICDTITETILKLSKVANVKVLMIKGNHDEDKITTLGYWLERVFRNTNVVVDFQRKQRKYYKYGENLIGFAHGDKEKSKIAQLPLIMAQEAKKDWGTTTYRKMYCGDLHHGFEYQFFKAKDMPGVEVEYLRSVGTTDTWHEDFGWIGIPKTAYLQIFDKFEGEFSRMKFNIK